jgi:NAD(P)H dehydrogenase (quinone)
MYAVTGITGRVGGAVAQALLRSGQKVRAVLRDPAKGAAWAERGCEIAVADMNDATALARAFADVQGVFVLPPPNFDPAPGFPEAKAIVTAVRTAVEAARPNKVVWLSTVGAQARHPNLLSQHTLMEAALADLDLPLTILRPAWFLDNAEWDVAPARDKGVIASFLQPLDRAIPMVATADIGRVAADLLRAPAGGRQVVELEGPQAVSPNDIAAAFGELLGRPVRAEAVQRETWGALFRSQGMVDPQPRIQMLDGFNEGWLTFENAPNDVLKGEVGLTAVLRSLL